MASRQWSRHQQRDELLAAPGEDVDAWQRRVRLIAVIDPLALAEEQSRQDRERRQCAARSRRRFRSAVRWLTASLTAVAVFAVLHAVAGLAWWLVVVSAIG